MKDNLPNLRSVFPLAFALGMTWLMYRAIKNQDRITARQKELKQALLAKSRRERRNSLLGI